MVDQKIVDFIKKMVKDGISLNTIKSQLKERGLSENEINDAIESAIPSETPAPNLEILPKESVKEKPRNYYKIILLILLLLILVSISLWFGMKGIIKILEEKGQATLQRNTEEIAGIQIACTTDVVFVIKSVCKSGTDYNVLIQNSGKQSIRGWKFRIYQDENTVKSLDKSVAINAFGEGIITILGTDLSTMPIITQVKKVEAFPVFEKYGKEIVCSQNVDAIGDTSGSPITTAC